MKSSQSTEKNLSDFERFIEVIEEVLKQFKSVEKLSVFEMGQRDGLLWAAQLAEEVEEKTSAANLKTSSGG